MVYYEEALKMIPGPQHLLLDLRDELQALYVATAAMQDFECEMNEMMDLLVSHIDYAPRAITRLDHYCALIIDSHHQSGNLGDGYIMAGAVKNFGRCLIRHFHILGLYGNDQTCHYQFAGWYDPFTPVLEKYLETDAFDSTRDREFYAIIRQ